MNATPSELLMRNFNEIFIELDPVRRAALLAESSPKIVSGFIPAAASWAETVLTKRLLRFADISLNTGIRSRMRSRPCTTSRPAGGEAGCLASHSTTQEPTSSKSAMDACHGSTRSSTSNCCFLEGRSESFTYESHNTEIQI